MTKTHRLADKPGKDDVRCANCGRPPPSQDEVELTDGKWLCQECINKRYSLDLLDYIKTRISVNKTEDEDQSKFVVRELVQNADDAYASIIVLRFEKDALYVANDGRAFQTVGADGGPGDFDKAAQVLRRFKAEEKESAGHFGSGFQTVYAITNSPEVHSNGISRALNPTIGEWENLEVHRFSPFMTNPSSRKGVLFRFPWRYEAEASKTIRGERPFEDRNFWPRWDSAKIRGLYDDLRGYLCDVILCCQRLKAVRIVWAAGGRPEAYQASRDFDLDGLVDKPMTVEAREGSADATAGWFQWETGLSQPRGCPESFDPASWRPDKDASTFRYLRASRVLTGKDGKPIVFYKDRQGFVKVGTSVPEGGKELKKNHIHLLLPFFTAPKTAFLYSVIPLPRRGNEAFVFSSHLIPTEDRKDVDVQGNSGANQQWYRHVMENVSSLFHDAFETFLKAVQQGTSFAEKQRMVLTCVPRSEIGEWMRPGRGDIEWASSQTSSMREWILSLPIVSMPDGTWKAPNVTYLAGTALQRDVLAILGAEAFPEEFAAMAEGVPWLSLRLPQRQFTPQEFVRIWEGVLGGRKGAGRTFGASLAVPATGGKVTLDAPTLVSLIRYAYTDDKTGQCRQLPLVPDTYGAMHEIGWYPAVPEEFKDLELLLPPNQTIHRALLAEIRRLRKEVTLGHEKKQSELPALIDEAVSIQPARFASLSKDDHRILSEAVSRMVLGSFSPRDASGKRFLPYNQGGIVGVGTPPEAQRPEAYERNWIFTRSDFKIPGMTEEIESRIKFLDMNGISRQKSAEIGDQLNIFKLAENANRPTNFVRHFLSPLHESLFEDRVLADFLRIRDRSELRSQKTAMLKGLQTYFDATKSELGLQPKDMATVPCLYDREGNWHPAGEFAQGADPILPLFGFQILHPDFDGWKKATLEALGVNVEVESEVVAKKIDQIILHPKGNRAKLGGLLAALLLSYDEGKLVSLREGLERAWVPVSTLGFSSPQNSIFPTEDILTVMGRDFDMYVEIDSIGTQNMEKLNALGAEELKKRLKALGLRLEPNLQEMTERVAFYARRQVEPPPKLLEHLSSALSRADPATRAEWQKSHEGMPFWKSGWFLGKKIRTLEPGSKPPFELEPLGLLPLEQRETGPFETYLRLIGSSSSLEPEDYLEALDLLAEKCAKQPSKLRELKPSHDVLWQELETFAGKTRAEAAMSFGHSPIFCLAGTWYSPGQVVLDDSGLVENPQGFVKRCLLPKGSIPWAILNQLGANMASGLGREELIRLLADMAQEETLTDAKADAYLRGLGQMAEKGWASKSDPLPWVCARGGRLAFKAVEDCYLANATISRSMPQVPLLVTSVAGLLRPRLAELASEWHARDFSSRVTYPDVGKSRQGRVPEIEGLLDEAYRGAASIFSDNKESLEWLRGVEVYTLKGTIQRFSIDGQGGQFTIPTLVPIGSNRTALMIPEPSPEIGRPIMEIIAAWAVGEGFPREKEANLAETLAILYQKAEESSIQEEEGPQTPGYFETRGTLAGWYTGCQICGSVTPQSEDGYQTAETVKSLISNRGGMLRGKLERYEVGNSLYLCPRHHVLMERRLVRFDFLDGANRDKQGLKEKISIGLSKVGGESDNPINCRVFEGNVREKQSTGWRTVRLTMTKEHAKALYEKLLDYFDHAQ